MALSNTMKAAKIHSRDPARLAWFCYECPSCDRSCLSTSKNLNMTMFQYMATMFRYATVHSSILLGCLALSLECSTVLAVEQGAAGQQIEFNRDVRPILAENCYACHGFDPKHREADLRLDTFDGATADRDGFRGIVPGNLEKSQVWQRVTSRDPDAIMPPKDSNKHALSESQLKIIKTWIEQGATYQKHWAFEQPVQVEPPKVDGASHPIDSFIRARLAREKLSPSPRAQATTLIRRAALDITGLPPTTSEVDSFVNASKSDPAEAYDELIDRLLDSPHFGERWGRWWLDQARYADSNGYSIDAPRQIWKFRDWVVTSLNEDMPFDQFTVEQLAGDLLPNATDDQKVATGFHRNTQINQEGGIDPEQFRIDSVFDRVATTGTVWLGLTIGCAQCHDHKFDPIEQREYYQLFAFFNNQEEPTLKLFDDGIDAKVLTAELKELEGKLKKHLKDHESELDQWEKDVGSPDSKKVSQAIRKILQVEKGKRTFAQNLSLYESGLGVVGEFREWSDRYHEIETVLAGGVTTMVLSERDTPRKTHVLIKGDFTRPDQEVQPGTPAVLHPLSNTSKLPNRLDLAKWIVSDANPLTSRVIVNRVWQQIFGKGIVETENDFGLQGTTPSHPELLDWLAVEFRTDQKWSFKKLLKLILTSETYQQSSAVTEQLRERDPNNYLLARQQRLRLDAEVVRDTALVASGLFSPQLGGPPVYPPIPDGVMGQGQVKRVWSVSPGNDKYRRGLYTFVYRASPPPSLTVFDAPEGFTTCTRRIRSNTPLQALTLMNDSSFYEFATSLEKIIEKEGLVVAFKRCTSRDPKPDELKILESLGNLNAARALLNLDETVTRE